MTDQADSLRRMMGKPPLTQGSGNARIVTITSGKGGVGKSTFSVNLAIALSGCGVRVLIVDADFGLANIDLMLGVSVRYDLSHVIRDNVGLEATIAEGHGGVKFISGGSGVYDLLSLREAQLQSIVSNLMGLEDIADVIIFDTGAGVTDNILRLVRSSTETIVVTTPEPTAIMDAYSLIKTVNSFEYKPHISVLINKAESVAEATTTVQSLQRIIYKYMQLNVHDMGYLLFDPLMTRAVKMQVPLVVSFPKSATARSIGDIAHRFMGTEADTRNNRGIAGFLNRLFKKV